VKDLHGWKKVNEDLKAIWCKQIRFSLCALVAHTSGGPFFFKTSPGGPKNPHLNNFSLIPAKPWMEGAEHLIQRWLLKVREVHDMYQCKQPKMLRPTGASSSSALQWTNALVTYAALLACCLYSGQRLQISFATYLSGEVKSKLLHSTVHSPRGMEHSVVLSGRLCFVRHTQRFDRNMQRLFDLLCIWKIQFSERQTFCSLYS